MKVICNICGRSMVRVGGDQHEEGWVCFCKNHCVTGPIHSSPVWHPMLTLMPSGSVAHASIWGALAMLNALHTTANKDQKNVR